MRRGARSCRSASDASPSPSDAGARFPSSAPSPRPWAGVPQPCSSGSRIRSAMRTARTRASTSTTSARPADSAAHLLDGALAHLSPPELFLELAACDAIPSRVPVQRLLNAELAGWGGGGARKQRRPNGDAVHWRPQCRGCRRMCTTPPPRPALPPNIPPGQSKPALTLAATQETKHWRSHVRHRDLLRNSSSAVYDEASSAIVEIARERA